MSSNAFHGSKKQASTALAGTGQRNRRRPLAIKLDNRTGGIEKTTTDREDRTPSSGGPEYIERQPARTMALLQCSRIDLLTYQ